MITRRTLLGLLSSASVGAALSTAAEAQGPTICRPYDHIWRTIGQAPGTGRPVLQCIRCGLVKIQ